MDMQFHAKEADFVSANWAYLKRHWWPFVFNYRLPIGMFVVAIAVLFLHPESSQGSRWILAIGIGLGAYVVVAHRWSWHRQFQRSARARQLISATVNGDFIRLSAENYKVVTSWSDLTDIYESDRVFMFATSKGTVMFLPKASLSKAQIEELRSLISVNARGKVRLASA
jgi:hypothetical protein